MNHRHYEHSQLNKSVTSILVTAERLLSILGLNGKITEKSYLSGHTHSFVFIFPDFEIFVSVRFLPLAQQNGAEKNLVCGTHSIGNKKTINKKEQ